MIRKNPRWKLYVSYIDDLQKKALCYTDGRQEGMEMNRGKEGEKETGRETDRQMFMS